ncbi:MAG: hypothetical protein ACREMB_25120, partial [Candidatus Rokuibacteriota bacterium]
GLAGGTAPDAREPASAATRMRDAPRPKRHVGLLSPARTTARRAMVAELHAALGRGDLTGAAGLNARLAGEAVHRAFRVLDAWQEVRDPATGLIPRSTDPRMAYWAPEDNGADAFAFFLVASLQRDEDAGRLWGRVLDTERDLCGPMPCVITLPAGRPAPRPLPATIFGASEYAKDGLLALTERFGAGPWFARLEEIAREIIRVAPVRTRAGPIPSGDAEVNGNVLQVLTRLYWATRNPTYVQAAERIADAYFLEVLPRTGYAPVKAWDFAAGRPESSLVRVRDHGSEIVSGLAELYLLERWLDRDAAARYRQPLQRLLERLLGSPRTGDGLWHNAFDFRTGRIVDGALVDTWGYLLNAYATVDRADGVSTHAAEIRRVMSAAASRRSYPWEGEEQDGYADALESMLYLLPWYDVSGAGPWLDDEMEVLLSKQFPSGFVEEWYLDGNFVRTALLYAGYKTQGIVPRPWRADVRVGAARDRRGSVLHVHLEAERAWTGALRFDPPRHRTIWRMPRDYPRLNATPEWYPVASERTYEVVEVETGRRSRVPGQVLLDGLPVDLTRGRTLRLRIVPPPG